MSHIARLVAVTTLALCAVTLAAPAAAQGSTAGGAPLVNARVVETGPTIDGDVLGDQAYADAMLATGFVQNRPFEGEPASERTEVRIVYTQRHPVLSESSASPKILVRSSPPTVGVTPT